MELHDYPILYRASNSSAINAEKRHFLLFLTRVVLLLVIAGVTSFAWNQVPSVRTLAAIVLAISLIALISVSAIINVKRFDRIWFISRAIAESVKTESWKFMMKVEPYNDALPDPAAEEYFLKRLDDALHRQPSVFAHLAAYLEEDTQITEHMTQIRKKPLEERKTHYVQDRIHDQRVWYTDKAKWNHTQESRWSVFTWILQLAAAAIAVILIRFNGLIINPIGILTTAGAGVLSWIHARSYQELSQSYGLVAQELVILEAQAEYISTEEGLEELVFDAERTISREHAMWLTRRLKLPRI